MSTEQKGEYKLLKVWECYECKALYRYGRDISKHKCEIKENELILSNKDIEEQKCVIEEQKYIIDSQKGFIEERDKLIEGQKQSIESQKLAIGSHKGVIKEQKVTIEEQNKIIEYYKRTIDSQNLVIEEQNKTIKERAEDDQTKTIETQKNTIENYRRTIDNQKTYMDGRDRTIETQKKIIEEQKRALADKDLGANFKNKNKPKIDNKDNGGISVHILEDGKSIKDSKDIGYREDIDIDIFAKGRGRERIIIKSGKLIKKPDDIQIIGDDTPEGFVVKGIYKN